MLISQFEFNYQKDRQKWRKQILRNVRRVKEDNGIEYEPDELFAVEVIRYMDRGKRHDIHCR